MPRANIVWTDDNKLVWVGGFNNDQNQNKRNTSVSYLFTFQGSKPYMPLFGQPIQLLHGNILAKEDYITYIQSQCFDLDVTTLNQTYKIVGD